MTAKGTYVPLAPAQRWGNALVRSMQRRGVKEADLAKVSGVAAVTLATWRKGRKLANLHQGLDAAAALGDEKLADLLRELRTRECAACGARFVAIRAPDARFCARSRCRVSQRRAARNAQQMEERLDVQRSATMSLRILQRAVDAFCGACEPEGLCRNAGCELRDHSPLKLADERLRIIA